MTPSVQTAERKIEWANKHIASLDKARAVFFNSYEVFADTHIFPGKKVIRPADAMPIPDDIALLAGDAVQNLRSALDHLAWQLVLVSGNTPNRRTYFPIFKSSDEFEREFCQKANGMRTDIKDAISLYKPYKEGNDILWALRELNNFDKHRLLLVVASTFDKIGFKFGKQPTQWLDMGNARGFKVGDLVYTTFGNIADQQIHFAFDIAFREPEVVQGKPVLTTIQSIADLVAKIVSDLSPFFG